MKHYKVKALFEVPVNANGSYFLVIYGKHVNGGFCCIPNRDLGCEMSTPDDTFYNFEKLINAGLNEPDAKAVALAIKQASEEVSRDKRAGK